MKRGLYSLLCFALVMISASGIGFMHQKTAYAATQYFNVNAYGADPTGVTDSTSAIQSAIDAAQVYTDASPSNWAVVSLGTGTYKLTDDLIVDNAKRITIQGAGQEGASATKLLMYAHQKRYIRVTSSEDIAIKDLQADHPDQYLPWTQLTVTDISGYTPTSATGYIDVTIDSGYPLLSNSMFDDPGANTLGFALNQDNLLTIKYFSKGDSNDPSDPTQWRYLVPGSSTTWRLHFHNTSWNEFFVGQRIALITANADGMAFTFQDSKNILVENVTNYASSFMGLWSYGLDGLTLRNYQAKPNTGRILSSTRDGLHLDGYNRGQLLIENSLFAGSGDDAINYHMRASSITKISDTQISISDMDIPKVGDHVEIYKASDRSLLSSAVVSAISGTTITLDQSIPAMSTGDIFYDNDASFQDAVIRNNTFLNHRGRGILPHGKGVSITGNTFEDSPHAMLINTIATSSGEGPINSEVYVANNTFDNIFGGEAIIIGGETASAPSIDSANDFEIVNNDFLNVTQPVLSVDFGDDIEFTGNSISATGTNPLDLINLGTKNTAKDVTIDDLEVTDTTGTAIRTVVSIERDAEDVTIGSIHGSFFAPQFINHSENSITFKGVSNSSVLGPAGSDLTSTPDKIKWDFYSSNEGWTVGKNLTLNSSNSINTYTINGTDASLVSPDNLAIPADKYKYIKIKMKNNTSGTFGQIFFITNSDTSWNGSKLKSFSVSTLDQDYTEYVVDMSTVPAWDGTIKQIRIDPPDQSATSGTGSIDYIMFSAHPNATVASPEWDFDSGYGGISLYNIQNPSVHDSMLEYTNITNPIITTQSLNINATDYKLLKIRMKNGSSGNDLKIYFTTDTSTTVGEDKRLNYTVSSNDGNFQTYYLDMTHNKWVGTIQSLRIDLPYTSGQTATSYIDSISLLSDLSVDAVPIR